MTTYERDWVLITFVLYVETLLVVTQQTRFCVSVRLNVLGKKIVAAFAGNFSASSQVTVLTEQVIPPWNRP
jgi:hypothetical protein